MNAAQSLLAGRVEDVFAVLLLSSLLVRVLLSFFRFLLEIAVDDDDETSRLFSVRATTLKNENDC